MTKERFIELVKELDEKQFEEIKEAINSNTFEYGWDNFNDEHELIKELWQED